jgi:hypothetical protein
MLSPKRLAVEIDISHLETCCRYAANTCRQQEQTKETLNYTNRFELIEELLQRA